jgi:hypothetical protein
MLVKTKLHQVYNGNFDITKMLDQSNLSVQRCRLIFWVECSVGGYLALVKTIVAVTVTVIFLRIFLAGKIQFD